MRAGPQPRRRAQRVSAVRKLHLTELAAAGAARALALEEAEEQLDRVARRLPDALQAGLSLAEISRETGISRPTLYELRARYGESASDLRLAVLQTVATRGPAAVDDLVDHIGRAPREISGVLEELRSENLVDVDVVDDPPIPLYDLTYDGNETLRRWHFQEDILDSEREGR